LWLWVGPGESQSSRVYVVALAVATASAVYYVAYSFFFVAQRKLRVPEALFSFSLRERLEAEIDYLVQQIAARTHWERVLLHLAPPWLACVMVVWAAGIRNDGVYGWHELLGLLTVTGSWIHMHILERKWVSRELVPRRRELEALHRKLVETG
jgi:hypothetical protein